MKYRKKRQMLQRRREKSTRFPRSMICSRTRTWVARPLATGLEGRTLGQLNILLADPDIQPWVSLIQVFGNIKIKLHKQEASKNGADSAERAAMVPSTPTTTITVNKSS